MDFRQITNSRTFIKKPGKKSLTKVGIVVAIVAVLAAGLFAVGYFQAKQGTTDLDERASVANSYVREQLGEITAMVNSSKTSNTDAIAALEQLARNAGEQTGACAGANKPLATFLYGGYKAASESCRQQEQAAAGLQSAIDQFIPDAMFMVSLQSALKPGLNAASAGTTADSDKVISAWKRTQSKLANIQDVPKEVGSAYGDLTQAVKTIIKQVESVKKAQASLDTDAFKSANKALAGAYEKLHISGGELRNWLIDEQKKLLEAAEL